MLPPFFIVVIVQNKVKKDKKRAVVSDCSFFVNMLNICARTLKISPKSALSVKISYLIPKIR